MKVIDDLLTEARTFPPPERFKKDTLVAGTFLYEEADEDYQGFWARQAADLLTWRRDWTTICEWNLPFARWFIDGQLNVAENCLDRHVTAGKGDKVAFYWEGEPGDARVITYAELLDEVQRFANVLKGLGVAKGDRVNIYLPMIPEAAIAMLACARIGAPHSVVFGASHPHRSLTGSTTRKPSCSSRPTAATAAATCFRSSRRPTSPSPTRRRSSMSSSFDGVATTSTWSRAATTGTTTS